VQNILHPLSADTQRNESGRNSNELAWVDGVKKKTPLSQGPRITEAGAKPTALGFVPSERASLSMVGYGMTEPSPRVRSVATVDA
jgi:hypothetical protein